MSEDKETVSALAKLFSNLGPIMKKVERSFEVKEEEHADKFPLTVTKVTDQFKQSMKRKPTMVRVRKASKEDTKTYLGFLLGDLVLGTNVLYDPEDKDITISYKKNPAIFIPALGEVVTGMESWWGEIKSEEDLKEITDETIEETWYVKMAKDLFSEKQQST